jgi:hypothetical protein
LKHLIVFDPAFGKGLIDTNDFLVYDPPGPDILVTDLAVAHHSLGQPDMETTGHEFRAGPFRTQAVRHRGLGDLDRITKIQGRIVVFPPSITYNQHDWFNVHRLQR